MKQVFGIFCLSVVLNSCAFLGKRVEVDEEFRKTKIGIPIIYEVNDPLCGKSKALKDLGVVRIWLADKDRNVIQREVDLTGISGSFQHESLESVIYGVETRRTSNGDKTFSSGKQLFLCKREYPRESIENVALASVSGIMRAHRLYQDIEGHKSNSALEKLSLLIHPRFSGENVRVRTTSTDGAFYIPDNLAKKIGFPHNVLAVLPHSKEYFEDVFNGIALWEAQATLSHEYGHHIFEKYYGAYRSKFKGWDLSTKELMFHTKTLGKNRLVIDALNEGFADLIAYYSHDSGLDPLSGVYFGPDRKNRDIASCFCDDESRKRITEEVLRHLFGEQTKSGIKLITDYGNVHKVGAFFATGINRVWADRFGSTASVPRTREKAQLLFEWLPKLALYLKDHQEDEDSSLFMENLVFLAASLGSLDGNYFTEEQCKHLHESFPLFSSSWDTGKPSCKAI